MKRALALLLFSIVLGVPAPALAFKMTAPHYPCTNCLNVGDSLTIGHSLRSPNGAYSLNFQSDHNVVLVQTSNNSPLWSTNTTNTGATKLSFVQINAPQELYILELTDSTGGSFYWEPRHSDGTAVETVDPFFMVQNDGNIVVYQPFALWTSQSDVFAGSDYDNRIGAVYFPPVTSIARGTSYSHSGCTLQFATNGNMSMVYFDPISGTNMTLWSSNTTNTGSTATMQSDGNFVIYNAAHQAVFNTGTYNHPLDWMVWQADCNLVIWDSIAQWARFGL